MNMYSIDNIPYAELLMLNRDFDRALAVCEAIRTVNPGNIALFQMGEIYYYRGDLDRSEAILEGLATSLHERLYVLMKLAMIAARRVEEAAGYLEKRALLGPPGRRPHFAREEINLASVRLGMGERVKGLAYLRAFFGRDDIGGYRHVYRRFIDIDPNFDAVRNDPEFKTILQGEAPPWPKTEPSV
jgi:tetratricopeptide (TPR) repeat protein